MKRVLLSVGLGLTICVGLVAPAAAQRNPGPDRQSVAAESSPAPADAPRVEAPPVDRPPTDVRPTDVRPTDERRNETDERPNEMLRLSCNGRMTDNGRAGVACTWSATTQRAAAGYRLVRTDGDRRTTVFRTDDLTRTSAIDSNIRLGVTYGYSILVVNERGETIGRGGPVRAGVDAPAPELEVLTLRCEAADERVAARCTWRPATSETAVGYQLWRIVNRGERELVWRGGLDQTSVFDDLPSDTAVVRYAVLAVDEKGDIVGRSRPVTLRFRHDSIDQDREPIQARLRHRMANRYR